MRKILMACLLAMPAMAFPAAAADLSQSEQEAIDRQISDYFIRNPEKLEKALDNLQVFMEARQIREREETLRSNATKLYRNKADYTMGPEDAPITIVEFFDYNCGYCKRSFAPLMDVLRDTKDVRLVFKEYPILGDDSRAASQMALAIEDRLKYLTYHSKLMTHKGRIARPVIDKILTEMNLVPNDVSIKSNGPRFQSHLNETRKLARAIGITGTPAFIINGTVFPGALDKDDLKAAIKKARADLKAK